MGFIVERKHKQTITTIVLPIFALGWLSMLSILIPLNSGEKVGFLGNGPFRPSTESKTDDIATLMNIFRSFGNHKKSQLNWAWFL